MGNLQAQFQVLKFYRQNTSIGFVVLGGMQTIKLEFGLDKNYLITAALFWFERNDIWLLKESITLNNTGTTQYGNAGIYIQEQTGQRQEELDRPPRKGKSPTLHKLTKQRRCQLQDGSGKKECTGKRQLNLQQCWLKPLLPSSEIIWLMMPLRPWLCIVCYNGWIDSLRNCEVYGSSLAVYTNNVNNYLAKLCEQASFSQWHSSTLVLRVILRFLLERFYF